MASHSKIAENDESACTDGGGLTPELLSLLLEMRAEMAAVRALILSRLDRLDKQALMLERSRANAPQLSAARSGHPSKGRGEAPARRVVQARARHTRLDDLSADLLALVAGALAEDDELAAPLSCRKLRSAVARSRLSHGRSTGRTAVRSAFCSHERLIWSLSCGLPLSEELCALAAEHGQLLQLRWLRSQGCRWDWKTCAGAAEGGHLAVLQWARANGCPWDEKTCAFAAYGGHLAVLQWAHANGCPWDQETCAYAAMNGHLAMLQWARASGCPCDWRTCKFAAGGGHVAVLQWARANGCPLHPTLVGDLASAILR